MARRSWLVGGVIVLLVTVLALLGSYALTSSAPDASCAARLIFQGRLYEAIGIARGSFTLAKQLGEATQAACFDSTNQDESGNVTREGSNAQSAPINAVDGVDPRVAIARQDDPSAIYVVAGRCTSYGMEGEFWTCLRSPLTFEGRLYVGTVLRTPSLHTQIRLTERLAKAAMAGSSVAVFRIEGVDPAVAVGLPGNESRVYIADGKCLMSGLAALARCVLPRDHGTDLPSAASSRGLSMRLPR